MKLDDKAFLNIIDTTPLVSVDLIIKNKDNQVLLGQRNNKPAQGYWFVPGGRIRKNETLDDAVKRVSRFELGITLKRSDSRLIGAFDHIYDDNFTTDENVNTHYVALGHEFIIDDNQTITNDAQHTEIKWFSIEQLLSSEDIHQNTKAYFL